MNPKVSVIVPVYGAEAFLPTCISSLRAQTLRDIELIFVCDGSPDHSLAILRRVEPLDSRIRVIAFEENQGVSAARNAGLDAARGDYIGFCDGDDWAEPQMYETLLRAAEEAGADVAFCRVFKDRGEARENVPLGFDDGTVFSREEIGRTLIPAMLSRPTDSDELPLSGYTPRNLFRREAIGSHRFRPDIRYAEDLLFIVACMKDARPRRRGGQGILPLSLSQRQRDQAFQLSRAGELRKIQRRAGGAFGGQPGVHAPDEDPPPQDGRRHRAQFLLPRNALRILGARAPCEGIYEQAGYRRAV